LRVDSRGERLRELDAAPYRKYDAAPPQHAYSHASYGYETRALPPAAAAGFADMPPEILALRPADRLRAMADLIEAQERRITGVEGLRGRG